MMQLAEQLRDQLQANEQITQVELRRVPAYVTHVEIPRQRLREYGLTLSDVADIIRASSEDVAAGSVETTAGEILLRLAERKQVAESGYVAEVIDFEVSEGVQTTVDKIITLYTSRDHAISEAGVEAQTWIGRLGSFDELLKSHMRSWDQLWRRFHLSTGADDYEAMVLNLHSFHLVQTVSKHTIDLDVGVPARGWHGEAYRGHIFWDELFIFPYLNLHLPDLTRALLLYRYRRLPEARWAAAKEGLQGALYPWQSGSSGREESQVVHLNPKSGRWLPDNSWLQRRRLS